MKIHCSTGILVGIDPEQNTINYFQFSRLFGKNETGIRRKEINSPGFSMMKQLKPSWLLTNANNLKRYTGIGMTKAQEQSLKS